MIFFLGSHMPSWLATRGVPLFVSRVRLAGRTRFPRAVAPWALDSGGFSEIAAHGRWTITDDQYIAEVRRYRDEIGGMMWAAPMDWMCEPQMIAKSGLSVVEHQRRTVWNYLELRRKAPEIPWACVMQGYTWDDYMRCYDMYVRAGVDPARCRLVGLGSVCRREATDFVADLAREFHGRGCRLHAFGLKIGGVLRAAKWLVSSDSMAWSLGGRKVSPCPRGRAKTCANCWHHARLWHGRVIVAIAAGLRRRSEEGLFA